MTEQEYICQQQMLGWKVHEHDGIFWRQRGPFFAQPVFDFRSFSPGSARPKRLLSFLGYAHQVPDSKQSNRTIQYMVLDRETVNKYSLTSIDGKKRNQVRQGLKQCEVKQIVEIQPWLEEMRLINISQAHRLMADSKFDTAPSAYQIQAEAWRSKMITLFSWPGREWWGAFVNGKLMAYLVTLHVENLIFFDATKTHTDAFKYRPTDALYHTILSRLSTDTSYARIINSPSSRPSLDEFKGQFLFRAVPIHYFYSNPQVRSVVVRGVKLANALSNSFHRLTEKK